MFLLHCIHSCLQTNSEGRLISLSHSIFCTSQVMLAQYNIEIPLCCTFCLQETPKPGYQSTVLFIFLWHNKHTRKKTKTQLGLPLCENRYLKLQKFYAEAKKIRNLVSYSATEQCSDAQGKKEYMEDALKEKQNYIDSLMIKSCIASVLATRISSII